MYCFPGEISTENINRNMRKNAIVMCNLFYLPIVNYCHSFWGKTITKGLLIFVVCSYLAKMGPNIGLPVQRTSEASEQERRGRKFEIDLLMILMDTKEFALFRCQLYTFFEREANPSLCRQYLTPPLPFVSLLPHTA